MLEKLDRYANEPSGPNTCKVRTVRDRMSVEDQERLNAALDDVRGFSTNSLFHALNELGVKIGYNSISRHRKKLCTCRRFDA